MIFVDGKKKFVVFIIYNLKKQSEYWGNKRLPIYKTPQEEDDIELVDSRFIAKQLKIKHKILIHLTARCCKNPAILNADCVMIESDLAEIFKEVIQMTYRLQKTNLGRKYIDVLASMSKES